MARTHEAGPRHPLRDGYQYHFLSPLSDAHGKHRRFPAQPSDCDDGGAGVLPSGLHDVRSFTRVLPSAPAHESFAFPPPPIASPDADTTRTRSPSSGISSPALTFTYCPVSR